MKYSWQIQRSQWAIQVDWVGQFTSGEGDCSQQRLFILSLAYGPNTTFNKWSLLYINCYYFITIHYYLLINMYPHLTKVGMIVNESANNLPFGGSLTSQVPPLLSGHQFHLEPGRGRSARFLSCSVSFKELYTPRYGIMLVLPTQFCIWWYH